jgi:4-diphosphocytidyl-2-C-methyl-D-erythritol kinase
MKSTVSKVHSANGYAKINLYLDILGTEVDETGDKKHLIDTLFYALELCDTVHIEAHESAEPQINIKVVDNTESRLDVPTNHENLAYKAVFDILQGLDEKVPPLKLDLAIEKNIPVCAGLGGGSADAGAALVAIRDLLRDSYDIEVREEKLRETAQKIGADVSFSLMVSLKNRAVLAARGTHFGEVLEELPDFEEVDVQLITQNYGLRAGDVYKRWDELNASQGSDDAQNLDTSDEGDYDCIKYYNALQSAAISLAPELQEVLNRLNRDGRVAIVSGSGPTVFVIEDL